MIPSDSASLKYPNLTRSPFYIHLHYHSGNNHNITNKQLDNIVLSEAQGTIMFNASFLFFNKNKPTVCF